MASSSTKKGAKKKAAIKKSAEKSAKKAAPPGKPHFANLSNGTLEVRLDNNQKITCPTHLIEPEIYRYFSSAARIEGDKIIIPVQPFDVSLTVARLQSLLEPSTNHTKDSLPGRILKVYENFGEFLEKQLQKRKWKVPALSEKSGVPRTTLSNYMNRQSSRPPMDIFLKTLKAFSIKLEEL